MKLVPFHFGRNPFGIHRRSFRYAFDLVVLVLPLWLAQITALAQSATQARVSFRIEVMAVLSKAGCNAGTCHGNKNGKGGFKLSLRGQDPDLDYLTLTRDLLARRANPFAPDQSLVLLKPTTQVAHEGGLRFKKDSPECEILRRRSAPHCRFRRTRSPPVPRSGLPITAPPVNLEGFVPGWRMVADR